jgi:hypothetical protein
MTDDRTFLVRFVMKYRLCLYVFTALTLTISSIQSDVGVLPKNPNIPPQEASVTQPEAKNEVDNSPVDNILGGKGNTIEKVKFLQKMIQPGKDLNSALTTINTNLGGGGGSNTMMNKVIQIQNLIYPKNDLSKAIIEINKQFGQMPGASNVYAKVQFINQKLGSQGSTTVLKLTQITNLIGAGHAPSNRAAVGATTYDKLSNLLARLKAHNPRLKNAKTLEEAVTLLEGPSAPTKPNPAHQNPTHRK